MGTISLNFKTINYRSSKKLYSIVIPLLLACFIINGNAFAQNVNIPDSNFKAALVNDTIINSNHDSEIQVTEASAYSGWISVSNLNISDLTGIEAFPAITYLDCGSNNLSSLNVSANTALTRLYCGGNNLNALNVSANTALTDLLCYFNLLTSLDVSDNTTLVKLVCYSNLLTSLNVSVNTSLTDLYCGNNQLTVLDVSNNIALLALSCSENQLSNINVASNTSLVYLFCNTNNITNLDVSFHNSLSVMDCNFNQLTALNVTGDTALTFLTCTGNQLASLDVSNFMHLYQLWCEDNLLTNLDLSTNTALTILLCGYNQLTSLNVQNGNNTNVTNFSSFSNPNLNCIQVDDAAYSTANWHVVDGWSSFSNNCFTMINEMNDTNDEFNKNTILSIYPNPASINFTINFSRSFEKESVLLINDVLGKTVSTLFPQNGETKIVADVSQLNNGIYFAVLKSSREVSVSKFVKE